MWPGRCDGRKDKIEKGNGGKRKDGASPRERKGAGEK